MKELRINNFEDRADMVTILIAAGYTVRVRSKKIKDKYSQCDYFVQIVEEPKCPVYEQEAANERD